MARMQRLWNERKSADVDARRQRIDRLVAHAKADFAETHDGDTVLRIETEIVHLVGHPDQEPVECDGCDRCTGITQRDVVVDSGRWTRHDAIRLVVRQADGLFERWMNGRDELARRAKAA